LDLCFGVRAGIFHGIVEQARDGLIFIPAVLHHQACDTHQVGQIGNTGGLAGLIGVKRCRQGDGVCDSA
jgi:hypothetical protein